jgi:hypothetical protein
MPALLCVVLSCVGREPRMADPHPKSPSKMFKLIDNFGS